MMPSGGNDDGYATFGVGQYFTDLPPTGLLTRVEYSYALYNSPRVQRKVDYWLLIDLSGLNSSRVKDVYNNNIALQRQRGLTGFGIFLVSGNSNLLLTGRIMDSGQTLFL